MDAPPRIVRGSGFTLADAEDAFVRSLGPLGGVRFLKFQRLLNFHYVWYLDRGRRSAALVTLSRDGAESAWRPTLTTLSANLSDPILQSRGRRRRRKQR